MTMYSPSVAARFWAKVDKNTGPTGCRLWRASHHPDGYGHMAEWPADLQVREFPRMAVPV